MRNERFDINVHHVVHCYSLLLKSKLMFCYSSKVFSKTGEAIAFVYFVQFILKSTGTQVGDLFEQGQDTFLMCSDKLIVTYFLQSIPIVCSC